MRTSALHKKYQPIRQPHLNNIDGAYFQFIYFFIFLSLLLDSYVRTADDTNTIFQRKYDPPVPPIDNYFLYAPHLRSVK